MQRKYIQEQTRSQMLNALNESGLLCDIQANYIGKVAEVIAESKNENLYTPIKTPKSIAQKLAADVIYQYLQNHKLNRAAECIQHESRELIVRSLTNKECAELLKTQSENDILHEIYSDWMKSDRKLILRPTAEDEELLHTILNGSYMSKDSGSQVARSRGINQEETVDDTTIGQGPTTTHTGDPGSGPRKPWARPPPSKVRAKPSKKDYVEPVKYANASAQLTRDETESTTQTEDTGYSYYSDSPPPEPQQPKIKKVIRKVPKKNPKPKFVLPEETDDGVQVTLTITGDTTTTTGAGTGTETPTTPSTKSKSTGETSYTYTYQSVPVDRQGNKVSTGETSYTYTYQSAERTPSTGNTSYTYETRTVGGTTIPTTDTFSRDFEAPQPSRHSTHSTRSQKSSAASSKRSSRHSEASESSSRRSTRDSTQQRSTQGSARRQMPPPSLAQPAAPSAASGQSDTLDRLAGESPLAAILRAEPSKQGSTSSGTTPVSVPTSGNSGSTGPGVTVGVLSSSPSARGSTNRSSQISSEVSLDSDTLGNVQEDSEQFKSDVVNSEKMTSDRELWNKSKH